MKKNPYAKKLPPARLILLYLLTGATDWGVVCTKIILRVSTNFSFQCMYGMLIIWFSWKLLIKGRWATVNHINWEPPELAMDMALLYHDRFIFGSHVIQIILSNEKVVHLKPSGKLYLVFNIQAHTVVKYLPDYECDWLFLQIVT